MAEATGVLNDFNNIQGIYTERTRALIDEEMIDVAGELITFMTRARRKADKLDAMMLELAVRSRVMDINEVLARSCDIMARKTAIVNRSVVVRAAIASLQPREKRMAEMLCAGVALKDTGLAERTAVRVKKKALCGIASYLKAKGYSAKDFAEIY